MFSAAIPGVGGAEDCVPSTPDVDSLQPLLTDHRLRGSGENITTSSLHCQNNVILSLCSHLRMSGRFWKIAMLITTLTCLSARGKLGAIGRPPFVTSISTSPTRPNHQGRRGGENLQIKPSLPSPRRRRQQSSRLSLWRIVSHHLCTVYCVRAPLFSGHLFHSTWSETSAHYGQNFHSECQIFVRPLPKYLDTTERCRSFECLSKMLEYLSPGISNCILVCW